MERKKDGINRKGLCKVSFYTKERRAGQMDVKGSLIFRPTP
jgi:hypothetical protein